MTAFTKDTTAGEAAKALKEHIKGKVVLITGCSPNGLGAEAALAIAAENPALVILAGRSTSLLEETDRSIKSAIPSVKLRILELDLANFASIRKAAAEVNGYAETVDVLINNAAIMIPPTNEKTTDGFESQWGVNHLGHFLLTNLLLPKMLGRGAVVANLTSGAYMMSGIRWEDPNFEKSDYNKWEAYAQSKTAAILFSTALAEKFGHKGIYSFSVDPGASLTKLGRHMTQEDIELVSGFNLQMIPQSVAAAGHVVASFDPSVRSNNGAYIALCNVSQTADTAPWSNDKETAEKLWALSEEQVGQKFGSGQNE